MDINFWQQLSELKTGILDVACALADDDICNRQKASYTLIKLSRQLHELENTCLHQMSTPTNVIQGDFKLSS
jgi:hypothetical protein